MPQPEFQQRLASVEDLVRKLEAAADPAIQAAARELVRAVMDLHGAGLERMLDLAHGMGEAGESLIQKFGRDELVASLLVLYGLHPLDLKTRLGRALDKARTRIRAHGGELELLSIQDGAVRLRIQANGHGCGSTSQSLKEAVEEAIYREAPDVASLLIEGSEEKQSFVPLEMLRASALASHASNGHSLVSSEKGGL
jgi:Fe-S cluster biogenesis protein NfuA